MWTHSNYLDDLSMSSKSLLINYFSFCRSFSLMESSSAYAIYWNWPYSLKQESVSISMLLAPHTTKKKNKPKYFFQNKNDITHISHTFTHTPRDWTLVSYFSCIGRWVLYHYCHLGSPTHSKMQENSQSSQDSGFHHLASGYTGLCSHT